VAPKIIEGIVRSKIDTVEADDLVTRKQASLIGGTAVLNVVDRDAGARGVEYGVPGAVKANLHRMANGMTCIIHPHERVKRCDETKNQREEIEKRTRERGPRTHGNTIVRQERQIKSRAGKDSGQWLGSRIRKFIR
jgi:hypothetical protein